MRAAVRVPAVAAGVARLSAPVAATVVVSLFAAATTVKMPQLAILAAAGAIAVASIRRWPVVVWGGVYASSLLLDSFVRSTVVLERSQVTIYLADIIPFVLIGGLFTAGFARPKLIGSARMAHRAGILFLALVLVDFYRSVAAQGITPGLQARHLVPLLLAVTLPYASRFAEISARTIVNTVTIAAFAISIAATIRLLGGYQTTSGLGVQRIYQTWEPFISAGLFLILLAFCLAGTKTFAYHYAALGASAVPVVFSFFRVAWVLTLALALFMLLIVRGQKGRAWIVTGLAVTTMILIGVGAINSQGGTSYAAQITMRTNEIHPHLDSYRSQEYGAVWREIRKNPVFGSGFGTEYLGNWTLVRSWCHNAYEWMWWRLGFVGLVTFLGFVLGAVAAGVAATRRLEGDDRALAIGLTAALVFLLGAANFHENFENYQSNLVNGLLIAEIFVLRSRAVPFART